MAWQKHWFQYAVLLFLALIWGSSFILMKVGLRSFNSQQAASLRIFLASFALLPYSIQNLRALKKKDMKYLILAGFLGNFIPAYLFMKAETRIDSAIAGMLNSMTPVFTLIIGLIFMGIRTWWAQLVGVFLGFMGALGLISSGENLALANINSYAFLIIIATTFYGININIVKTHLTHLRGVQITSLSFLFIGPAALLVLLTTDLSAPLQSQGWIWHFSALAILGVVGSAFAMLIMNSLIRYTSAVFASSVTYIIPVFAIMWGLLDGEDISWMHLIFMATILAGVYLINRRKITN